MMTPTTLILYKCSNPSWGEMLIETDEHFPTSERALEIYKSYLVETPLGKSRPSLIDASVVEEQPKVIFGVMLNEEKVMKLI
ncbi:MAG: hypothetical protein J6Y37_01930 [Paludibacteraceae bacterium]|nr:hypothetical protein [Paludibacteraceae bacterium]